TSFRPGGFGRGQPFQEILAVGTGVEVGGQTGLLPLGQGAFQEFFPQKYVGTGRARHHGEPSAPLVPVLRGEGRKSYSSSPCRRRISSLSRAETRRLAR